MTSTLDEQINQLKQAIADLESQRPILGDAAVDAALVPQEFPAVTVISPFCPTVPAVTDMDVVPLPEFIVHPVGTVHA